MSIRETQNTTITRGRLEFAIVSAPRLDTEYTGPLADPVLFHRKRSFKKAVLNPDLRHAFRVDNSFAEKRSVLVPRDAVDSCGL